MNSSILPHSLEFADRHVFSCLWLASLSLNLIHNENLHENYAVHVADSKKNTTKNPWNLSWQRLGGLVYTVVSYCTWYHRLFWKPPLSFHELLTINPNSHGGFFVSCLTAVGHMRHPFKADLGEKWRRISCPCVRPYARTFPRNNSKQSGGGKFLRFSL